MAGNDLQFDLNLETKQFVEAMRKATNATDRFEKDFKTSMKGTSGAFDVFKGTLGAQAAISGLKTLGSAAASVFTRMIKGAAQVETLTTQLSVLTGSTANASQLIRELKEFAAATPFELVGITEASKKLLAFGFNQAEVTKELRKLGDVSAATGTDLNELTTIYGQVAAAGKLTGERLNQLQERAIPIGPAIAKTMGVAEESVRDLVSAGEVTTEVFQAAFATISDEGGLAFGGMEKRSKTLEGLWSTLNDTIDDFLSSVGKELVPVAKTAVKFLTQFIEQLDTNAIKKYVRDGIRGMIRGFKDFVRFFTSSIGPAFEGLIDFALTLAQGLLFIQNASRGIQSIAAWASGDEKKLAELETAVDNTRQSIIDLQALKDKSFDFNVVRDFSEQFAETLSDSIEDATTDGMKKGAEEAAQVINIIAKKAGSNSFQDIGPMGPVNDSAYKDFFDSAKQDQRYREVSNGVGPERQSSFSSAVESFFNDDRWANIGRSVVAGIKRGGKEGVGQVVGDVVGGFFSEWLGEGVGGLIGDLIKLFSENNQEQIKLMIEGFLEGIPAFIEGLVAASPVIIETLVEMMPELIPALAEAILRAAVMNTAAHLKMAAKWTQALLEGIHEGFNWIFKEALPYLIEGYKQFKKQFYEGLGNFFKSLWENLVRVFENVGNFFGKIFEPIKRLIDNIWQLIQKVGEMFNFGGGGDGGGVGGFIGQVGGALGLATGGYVTGSGNKDTVPAVLTPGEVVVDRSTGPKLMNFLDDYNSRPSQGPSQDNSAMVALLSQILVQLSQPQSVSTSIQLDRDTIADVILELSRDNERLA